MNNADRQRPHVLIPSRSAKHPVQKGHRRLIGSVGMSLRPMLVWVIMNVVAMGVMMRVQRLSDMDIDRRVGIERKKLTTLNTQAQSA